MSWTNLKAAIAAAIKTNNNQEITGAVLQNTLNSIVNSVGANATFAGIATPVTNPGTPDGPVFWIASESGTYSNFGSIELQDGLSVLMWNGSWSSQQIFDIDDEPTAGSDNLVKSGGVSYLDQAVRKGCIAKNAYYSGNHAVGETFQESEIQPNSGWVLYSMQCQGGDVINFTGYANYLLVVDSDNTILVSVYSPIGHAPNWVVIPQGGVHIYLCGQATKSHYLYLYPKMVINYKDYKYNMFQDVEHQGLLISGLTRISYNVPFNFYESITYDEGWLTSIICVENCKKVLVSGYGQHAYSATGEANVYAYVFLDKNLLPIAGADKASIYENVVVDVPNSAKYCIVNTAISTQPNCVLCAITDKENILLQNNILKKLGVSVNKEGVFDITNKGYFCNAVRGNIGDTVTPELITNSDWCSDIIEVEKNDRIYFNGYETTYIILDSANTIISKKYYAGVQEGSVIIPSDGVKFVYVTFSANIKYFLLDTQLSSIATINIIDNTISREPINIINVKKDGTGDYANIQAAIDAVKGMASINNQYQIRIFDDWKFSAEDLHYVNSGDCAIDTANYVHLYGMNGVRTLEIVSTSTTYQVLWWFYNANLENLHFKINNSRYAVHQSGLYSGKNPEYITRKAVNCIFEINGGLGCAVGTDIQNGEETTFEGCTFIGDTQGWYGHSSLTSYNAKIVFNNCTFKVPYGRAAGLMSLDSVCSTTLTLNNCKFDNTSYIENMGISQYGNNNGLPVGAVFPNINVYGCGNYLFKTKQGNYLRVQAPQNVSITSISGTAYKDVFGGTQFERVGRNGLAGVAVGNNCILYQATGTAYHPYLYSLGCRLGDCSVNNKTLVIALSNEDTVTITFDKAYSSDATGATAPTYTNEQIIAEMNTALSSIGVSVSEGFGSEYDFYPNTDIKEYVAAETNVIPQKKFVHIKENGLAELANGNNVDGFALADIPIMPSSSIIDKSAICTSKQILLGQVYSPTCPNTADGTKFTITNGELLEVSAESADYVAIVYNNVLKLK